MWLFISHTWTSACIFWPENLPLYLRVDNYRYCDCYFGDLISERFDRSCPGKQLVEEAMTLQIALVVKSECEETQRGTIQVVVSQSLNIPCNRNGYSIQLRREWIQNSHICLPTTSTCEQFNSLRLLSFINQAPALHNIFNSWQHTTHKNPCINTNNRRTCTLKNP